MPYELLQSILSVAFLAVWFFIAATYLRDKMLEARERRLESSVPAPHFRHSRRSRRARRKRVIAGA